MSSSRPVRITSSSCAGVPAVMLESAQQTSLRSCIFGLISSAGSARKKPCAAVVIVLVIVAALWS